MAAQIRPVASHGPRIQPVASHADTEGALRFTEEDLKELAESRALTKADLDAMHPDDRAAAYRAMNAVESKRHHLGSDAMVSLGPVSVNPEDVIGGIAALPRMRPMMKAGGEILGTGAALYGIEKAADALKLPAPVRYGLEASLGLRALGRRFGGKPASAPVSPLDERVGLPQRVGEAVSSSSPLQAQPLEMLRARHQLLANTAVRSLEQEQQFQALDRLFRQGSSATGRGYAAVGSGLQPK